MGGWFWKLVSVGGRFWKLVSEVGFPRFLQGKPTSGSSGLLVKGPEVGFSCKNQRKPTSGHWKQLLLLTAPLFQGPEVGFPCKNQRKPNSESNFQNQPPTETNFQNQQDVHPPISAHSKTTRKPTGKPPVTFSCFPRPRVELPPIASLMNLKPLPLRILVHGWSGLAFPVSLAAHGLHKENQQEIQVSGTAGFPAVTSYMFVWEVGFLLVLLICNILFFALRKS